MNLDLFKKELSSINIIVLPYRGSKTKYLSIPVVWLGILALFAAIGGGSLVFLALSGLEYKAQHRAMAEKVRFYSEQFSQWDSTLAALKNAESKFRSLFSFRSREEVLQYADTSSLASLEIPSLSLDIKRTVQTVSEIRDYLRRQKDAFAATPVGYPVQGNITSNYGQRSDPLDGDLAFHSGIDISCPSGTPVRATADGLVSHSGWVQGKGFVVVLEHGIGFSTLYAHNETNAVKVGARVKRGDVIAYAGSTGRSTGPHVHYEVWKNGKAVNPRQYLPPARRSETRGIAGGATAPVPENTPARSESDSSASNKGLPFSS